jgi:two-component system, sensor histidine kinase LadS
MSKANFCYLMIGWTVVGLFLGKIKGYSQPIVLQSTPLVYSLPDSKDTTYLLQLTNITAVSEFILILPRWGRASLESKGQPLQRSGMLLPLSERAVAYFQPAFRLRLVPHKLTTITLSLKGEYRFLTVPATSIKIIPLETFYQEDRQRLLSQGLFLGIIVVMALYNLLIFWAVRDISFLWFVVSLVGVGGYFMFYYGFGIELLWPQAPLWDTYCFAVIVPATNLARLFFTKTYLPTSELLPHWNRWLSSLMALEFAVFSVGLCSYFFLWDTLHWVVNWVGLFGVITFALMLVVGVAAYQKGYKPARFFVLANALFVLGGILFILREMNLLPDNFLTRYAVQSGVIAQVVLFSLGLANRLNQTQIELGEQKLEKEKIAQKEAQQAELNRLKDKLLSVISHDLRSPLVSFESFFNLLSNHFDQLDKAEILKLTQTARGNLDQQKQLLNNLLEWAKSQWEGSSFKPEPLVLTKIIERNTRLLEPLASSKNIELSVELEDTPVILADREMIEFVVRNLIHNAIKFSYPESDVKIILKYKPQKVVLQIKDKGVGMSAELLQAILRNASGFSTKGTANEKGTGLGLVICREFVIKNSGQLQIESTPDEGTTVEVSFDEYHHST